MPGGSWSLTAIGPGASEGPALAAAIPKVIDVPAVTVASSCVLVSERSADATTSTAAESASSPGSSPGVLVATVASLTSTAPSATPAPTATTTTMGGAVA